jgi:hypothetical protein
MTLLDEVIQMHAQGLQDPDIIKKLRDEGISPREINDTVNQAKIKEAVSSPEESYGVQPKDMEESILKAEPLAAPKYIDETQEQPQEQQQYYPEQQYVPQEQQYEPEPQYYQSNIDVGTITEIAEQIVAEKFAEFNKKTGDLILFKNQIQEKVDDLDERLQRIENSIDKLQQAIIRKIGEFGETSAYIHKDLDNIHNTMSKLMNPLIDNYNELKKISGKR